MKSEPVTPSAISYPFEKILYHLNLLRDGGRAWGT